jgi:hypothetical protein
MNEYTLNTAARRNEFGYVRYTISFQKMVIITSERQCSYNALKSSESTKQTFKSVVMSISFKIHTYAKNDVNPRSL